MSPQLPLAALAAALLASATIAPVPDLAFITQFGAGGALIGTLAVLRSDARLRRKGERLDGDRRWTIVARWTILAAGLGTVVDIVLRVLGGS